MSVMSMIIQLALDDDIIHAVVLAGRARDPAALYRHMMAFQNAVANGTDVVDALNLIAGKTVVPKGACNFEC